MLKKLTLKVYFLWKLSKLLKPCSRIQYKNTSGVLFLVDDVNLGLLINIETKDCLKRHIESQLRFLISFGVSNQILR